MEKDLTGASEPPKTTYLDKERFCESRFSDEFPFWHLFTQGKLTEILFISEEDFRFVTNLIGICADRFPDVKMYTFVIMNNHVHEILSGKQERCQEMFDMFYARLQRYFGNQKRTVDLTHFKATLLPITDLKALRNEIVYVNRNGYVANSAYSPFSYPWGAGNLYFSSLSATLQMINWTPFNALSLRAQRRFGKSKDTVVSNQIKVYQDIIFIPSFCYIKEGESFFRDAHHYFSLLSRNYEANSLIAKKLGDSMIVSDEEMYYVACYLSESSYNVKKLTLLTPCAKLDIAKTLHFDYNATNQQLRRILKLSQEEINTLFPKSI